MDHIVMDLSFLNKAFSLNLLGRAYVIHTFVPDEGPYHLRRSPVAGLHGTPTKTVVLDAIRRRCHPLPKSNTAT